MTNEIPIQNTLAHRVSCVGVALHTGQKVAMTLHPAPENTGIVFQRADLKDQPNIIPACYKNVTNTMLGTTITNAAGVSVSTIEHLMAALWGCGIDNARIELDGAEVPIMDGSSEPFVFLIECAGRTEQNAPRKMIEVLKTVEVVEGDKRASIAPASNFGVELEISFASGAIAKQQFAFNIEDTSFKTDLSRARTFGFEHEVEKMRSMGLALGGSLDNAIVVSGDKVLNKEGLRYKDEFVRHKVLDCIGDFYLAGGQLVGQVSAARTGHGLNNKLLHKLFSTEGAWRLREQAEIVDFPIVQSAAIYAEAIA